jgi:pre-mRNA-splicing factor 18
MSADPLVCLKGLLEKQQLPKNVSVDESGRKTYKRRGEVVQQQAKKTKVAAPTEPLPLTIEPELPNVPIIPKQEVFRRLRSFGQPDTLFGETDTQRVKRLLQVETEAGARESSGLGNDMALARVLTQQAEQKRENEEQETVVAVKRKVDPSYVFSAPRSESQSNWEWVSVWLKHLLHHWEDALTDRDPAEKRSLEGVEASAVLEQTKQYMKPLFHQLKGHSVPDDIMTNMLEIVSHCKYREYVRANDAYVRLAIGNAAWPMGVTMVGIHERSARENISASQVAHVLNNEVQRKYVTGLKRLMTYAQKHYPPIMPSKAMG